MLQDVNLLPEELRKRWWSSDGPFHTMQEMLRRAADALDVHNRRMFTISVTEEEILNGVIRNSNRKEQSLFIRREITDIGQLPESEKKNFDDSTADKNAAECLVQLKDTLTSIMGKSPSTPTTATTPDNKGNTYDIAISVKDIMDAQHKDKEDKGRTAVAYIQDLSDQVCEWLWDCVSSAYRNNRKTYQPLFAEVLQHLEFMNDKLAHYVPVARAEKRIGEFLKDTSSNSNLTFVLHAGSGAGKTSLVAWAARYAIREMAGVRTVVRFLGTTPQSSDVVSLLKSVCNQLHEFLADVGGSLEGEDEKQYTALLESGTHMQLSELMITLLAKLSDKKCQVCLFLDSLDQLLPWNNAHDLHWLPRQSPPGIKVFISILEQQSPNLLGQLKKLYTPIVAKEGVETSWSYSVPAMSREDASKIVDEFLSKSQSLVVYDESKESRQTQPNNTRVLTKEQKHFLLKEYEEHPTPLFLRITCDIASSWTSYDGDYRKHLKVGFVVLLSFFLFGCANVSQKIGPDDLLELCGQGTLPPWMHEISPIKHVIARIYHNLTAKHGMNLVRQTLRYLVTSKNGLSSSELVDLLSCDELVLAGDDVFKWWNPPVRRLPDLLWKRLREDLAGYISDRGAYGLVLHQLYHRQFWETAELLFLPPTGDEKQAVACHLAKFFNGEYSTPSLVPFTLQQDTKAEDRLVAPQPLSFGRGKFNMHKLAELPFQQVNSGDFKQLCTSLFNFEFIEAKLAAGMVAELLEDYRYAIAHITGSSRIISSGQGNREHHTKKLAQFYQFLRRFQHFLRDNPSAVLQFALNEPDNSSVSVAAREQRVRNAVYCDKVWT